MADLTFTVDVKGENTDRQYTGVFTTKARLTQRDYLLEDQIRRDIIGTNAQAASAMATGISIAVSYLKVRVLKAPKWWTDSDGGLDLEDDNILAAIYYKAVEAEKEDKKVLADQAEKARQELKKNE
jgi:hypothetical protein